MKSSVAQGVGGRVQWLWLRLKMFAFCTGVLCLGDRTQWLDVVCSRNVFLCLGQSFQRTVYRANPIISIYCVVPDAMLCSHAIQAYELGATSFHYHIARVCILLWLWI